MKNLNLVKKFEIAAFLKDQNEADIFLAINQSEASWLAYQYGCLFLSQRMSDDWNRAEAIQISPKKNQNNISLKIGGKLQIFYRHFSRF